MPTVRELRVMASDLQVTKYSRLSKVDLIHAIQTAEGNQPCFGRIDDCGQVDCLFFAECQGRKPV